MTNRERIRRDSQSKADRVRNGTLILAEQPGYFSSEDPDLPEHLDPRTWNPALDCMGLPIRIF